MKSSRPLVLILFTFAMILRVHADAAGENRSRSAPLLSIGAARIDITPRAPIRLAGYAQRVARTWEVVRPLHARALAIGSGEADTVLLITMDLAKVTEEISDVVAEALWKKHRIERSRIALCATHTHTGPSLRGMKLYKDVTAEDLAAVARYTEWLQDQLISVAGAALAARQPARLSWGEGRAGFAVNRRKIENGKWVGFGTVPDGPADHTLPVMAAKDSQGNLLAAFVSYACHCTTLGGAAVIHSDWAGEAAMKVESSHPGAIALIGQGCGGDANPWPRGSAEAASTNGKEIAAEVERLLATSLRPLGPVTATRYRRIELPLDRVGFTDAQRKTVSVEATVPTPVTAGWPSPSAVPYPVQTWIFGKDLAMVFLGGEVVSEYSLRLRREMAPERLWVNAYANSVPCYIPSKRMYPEGGYEVENSMLKQGWPARLAIETEDRVIDTVRSLIPPEFVAP